MVTSILAIVTAFVGLAVIIAGVWGAVVLMAQKADTPVPLRYYAIVIEMIGIGVGLLGIAQALRILLLILAKVAIVPPLKHWGRPSRNPGAQAPAPAAGGPWPATGIGVAGAPPAPPGALPCGPARPSQYPGGNKTV